MASAVPMIDRCFELQTQAEREARKHIVGDVPITIGASWHEYHTCRYGHSHHLSIMKLIVDLVPIYA